MTSVILLDVDGVLVHDGGYRAGIAAAVNHFAGELGLSGMAPTPGEVDAFHAAGFTNEWDIIPFVVGILRLEAAAGGPEARPDYVEWAGRSQDHEGRPSERGLAALLACLAVRGPPDDRKASLEAGLRDLLADTYDVSHCPTTQVFQEFVLGSSLYAAHYGLSPRFDTASLLEAEDRPALTDEGRECLQWLVGHRDARVCIYTARPSGPPLAADLRHVGETTLPITELPGIGSSPLAPEAELAVQAVGLGQYPLIAMGRMQWLAARHGDSVESLTKPSPVHPLAAVGAAWNGDERRALEAAYVLVKHGEVRLPLADLAGAEVQVYVLEDSTIGLQAAAIAQSYLEASGLLVRMRGVGVTRSSAKADALSSHCDLVVADVNAGLAWIASQLAARCESRDPDEIGGETR